MGVGEGWEGPWFDGREWRDEPGFSYDSSDFVCTFDHASMMLKCALVWVWEYLPDRSRIFEDIDFEVDGYFDSDDDAPGRTIRGELSLQEFELAAMLADGVDLTVRIEAVVQEGFGSLDGLILRDLVITPIGG